MTIQKNCPDCGTKIGQAHQDGCDIERCPHCGQQWIGCQCKDHDPSKTLWTGDLPDSAFVTASTQQFDFEGQWQRAIVRHLDDPMVITALTLGLILHDPNYTADTPPWLVGRGPLNGQQADSGSLSWYQPWGRCHHIAPFSWALGRKLYPELEWGFINGPYHTVVIGYRDGEWKQPELVMDILLFQEMTARESLALAQSQEWQFYPDLMEYAASFCSNPEFGMAALSETGVSKLFNSLEVHPTKRMGEVSLIISR